MKRVALAILAIALSAYIISAQSVTERFATALNNQDILYLQENLPYYKDSLPQHISLMAEALCYSQTNRYHKSNKAIEELAADGTLLEIAKKYKLENQIIVGK